MRFVTVWARPDLPAEAWQADVIPLATPVFAAQLRTVLPANVPGPHGDRQPGRGLGVGADRVGHRADRCRAGAGRPRRHERDVEGLRGDPDRSATVPHERGRRPRWPPPTRPCLRGVDLMDPATLLAAHLGRAVAPYLWRALGVAAAVLACVALTLVLTVAGAVTRGSLDEDGQPSRCGSTGSTLPAAGGSAPAGVSVDGVALDAEQLANAAVIAATGRQLGIGEHGVVVALATATQESRLRNLDYGDADSVGLFQQRPSQGWGQVSELLRPDYAATKFYQALARVPGWEQLPVSEAAQAVQRSAFPTAYARWETLATALAGFPRFGMLPVRWSTPSGRCSPTPPVSGLGCLGGTRAA